jgi:hypothetical protein
VPQLRPDERLVQLRPGDVAHVTSSLRDRYSTLCGLPLQRPGQPQTARELRLLDLQAEYGQRCSTCEARRLRSSRR